ENDELCMSSRDNKAEKGRLERFVLYEARKEVTLEMIHPHHRNVMHPTQHPSGHTTNEQAADESRSRGNSNGIQISSLQQRFITHFIDAFDMRPTRQLRHPAFKRFVNGQLRGDGASKNGTAIAYESRRRFVTRCFNAKNDHRL